MPRRTKADPDPALHISETLSLPLEAATETFAVLAKRGKGKTYFGSVLAEEFIGQGIPVLIVDPMGVWWGLRSSADGNSDGLPVVIFGGDHADVPLTEASAELVADAVVSERFSAILDLSHFSKAARRRFMTHFIERFYHRNRGPIHVIVDEADLFCMSADTEILTEAGWKTWDQVRPGTVAVTFDLETETYDYGEVSRVLTRHFTGEMVSIKTKGLHCLVTPDHRVVLRRERRGPNRHTSATKTYPWTFVAADEVPGQVQIPCGGAPTGTGIDDLDAVTLRMLGWFITDGFHHDRKKSNSLCLQQSLGTVKAGVQIAHEMDSVLTHLPGVSRYERASRSHDTYQDRVITGQPSYAWYLNQEQSERVWKWLEGSLHRLPRRILEEASREQLEHLFQGLIEGDGTTKNGEWERFFPGQNEGLADDFQELALRLGKNTLKTWVPQIGQWHVVLNKRSTHHRVRKIGRENYSGLVWDITVPTGAFVARRNGRVFVTGNCPQRAAAEGAPLLGAMEDLQRRGRARGIGTTMITQRPAVLHKDILSQAEVLIALGMTGPRDVAAIDEWVRLNADDADAREVKASLPSLPVGTAWVWSPGFLDVLEKVQIRQRRTYDSSATPKVGVVREPVKKMAAIDLDRLGEQIASAAKVAEETDPKALRRRVKELESQVAARAFEVVPNIPDQIRIEVPVEVPVLSDEDRALLRSLVEQGSVLAEQVTARVAAWQEVVDGLVSRVGAVGGPPSAAASRPGAVSGVEPAKARPSSVRKTPSATSPVAPANPAVVAQAPAPTGSAPMGDGGPLPKAARKVLVVLAQHGTRSTTQTAILAGYSHKSGGYRNTLSSLRTSGYIDGRGEITITKAGLEALGRYDPLPSGPALLDWWKDHHLGKCERAIVDVLAEAYPSPVKVDVIAEQAGYSASSGGFRNSLSHLRTLELASGRGELVLSSSFA